MKNAPDLSIVVASWSNDESLARCLGSLAPQWTDAEVIVATNRPSGELGQRYSKAKFLRGPKGATVVGLRTLGADSARGQLVALLEDHAEAGPDWATALREAHRAGHKIMGGPVENGLQSHSVDWALYFVEYGVYMPPMRKGAVPRLSGLNIAYDRELLRSCREVWKNTLQENEINDALGARGHKLHLAPDALVRSYLPMSLRHAMAHLRDGARHFAHYRASRCSRARRVFWLLTSPLVPAVLFWRLASGIALRRPARLVQLLRALPFLALLLAAWGWGEATGYLRDARAR